MASISHALGARGSPATLASSTAASCRLLRRASRRKTSSGSPSCTAATHASSPTTGARSHRRTSRGTRPTSRIEQARAAGGEVVERDDGTIAVHVAAAVTHTMGGLRVDKSGRVAGTDGIWAAGVDAGGVASGGYASGLAQALVLGLAAAESIAAEAA
jgi:succinate dehydrogenase/fumarate reductase flavoprotein subunit